MVTPREQMERAAADFEAMGEAVMAAFVAGERAEPCEFTDHVRFIEARPDESTCVIDVDGQHFEVGVDADNADYVRQVASALLMLAENADPTGLELIRTDPEEAR